MAKNNKKVMEMTLNFQLTKDHFNMIIGFLLSGSPIVSISSVQKVKEIVGRLNINNYKDDEELLSRIYFLKSIVF